MRIIAKKHLLDLARLHGDCVEQIAAWHAVANKATWQNLSAVRLAYPGVDLIGDKMVFNIKGNHYRLIVYIRYDLRIIWIKDLLTHSEYDKGAWKP